MDLKVNDIVVVDGKQSKIEAIWSAGAYKRFKLADGRELLDLHKNPNVGRIEQKPPEVTIKQDWKMPFKR